MEETIQVLLNYGPGGVIAVLVILGLLIPKSVYEREIKRGDLATQAASQNAAALLQVSEAVKLNTGLIATIKEDVNDLKAEVAKLKDELIRQGVGRV